MVLWRYSFASVSFWNWALERRGEKARWRGGRRGGKERKERREERRERKGGDNNQRCAYVEGILGNLPGGPLLVAVMSVSE